MTTTDAPEVQAVGTAAKSFRTFGWHAYNWTTYYAPADPASGGVWNTFSASVDADPTAIATTIKTNQPGSVTVYWGTKPGGYGSHSPAMPVAAGTSYNFRITGLKRKTKYYVNATLTYQAPAANGGVAHAGSAQYGEVSYTTT